jgi:hypothetical protein
MAPNPVSLGRYVLHRELASGGMAAVYFGRLIGPSGFARTVAIKRPHAHLMKDRDFAMMLIDEARLAARIRHPNVVSTLDVIETESELALVMDYVHGEALSRLAAATRSRGESVPLPIAAAILIDALHGLHAAHEAADETGRPLGIVHRDVSPQNLIVGGDGITRIVDFGIAKAAGRLLTTRDGSVKGKYAYMAPEQIRGQPVTRQTDIFAASIVLWELLTGEGLFRGANEGEEVYKCLEGVADPPSTRNPKVPPAFDAIVLRGLAKTPSERYATAREMASDIERAAPAVRPSEIGAWVERLAGGILRGRAEIIAEMERTTTDPAAVVPGLALTSAAVVEKGASEPGGVNVVFADRERSQVSHAGVVAERLTPPVPSSPRVGGKIALGIAALALVVGVYGAARYTRRSAAGVGPDAASPSIVQIEPPAMPSSVVSVEAVAPVTPAPVPLSPVPVKPSATPSATAKAPPPASSAASAGSKDRDRTERPSTKQKSSSCNPPYTVDAQGREIFKEQCL